MPSALTSQYPYGVRTVLDDEGDELDDEGDELEPVVEEEAVDAPAAVVPNTKDDSMNAHMSPTLARDDLFELLRVSKYLSA